MATLFALVLPSGTVLARAISAAVRPGIANLDPNSNPCHLGHLCYGSTGLLVLQPRIFEYNSLHRTAFDIGCKEYRSKRYASRIPFE
jgi:hypothetical protein